MIYLPIAVIRKTKSVGIESTFSALNCIAGTRDPLASKPDTIRKQNPLDVETSRALAKRKEKQPKIVFSGIDIFLP